MEKDAVQPESTLESVTVEEAGVAAGTLFLYVMDGLDLSQADTIHVHISTRRGSRGVNISAWADQTLKTDAENDSTEKETVEPLNR